MKTKCEHIPCTCMVDSAGYRSDACGLTAGRSDESESGECGCHHHACSANVAGLGLGSALARSRGSD